MIDSVRLVNCQSWADGTIHLASDRINVIAAPNQTGKSVLLKVLKISVAPNFYGVKKRKRIIRWGAPDAKAIYKFVDGSVVVVVIQPNRVVYFVRGEESEQFTASLTPPQELIDGVGLMVNSAGTFIANIIDTDQNLLLVDSDAKSTYEYIHMLCNNATLDEQLEKLGAIKAWMSEHVSSIDFRLADLNRKLDSTEYVDIYAMQERLDRMARAKAAMYALVGGALCLNRIEKATVKHKEYGKLLSTVRSLQTLEAVVLGKFRVAKEPTGFDIVDVLGVLERIDLDKFKAVKEPAGFDIIDALGVLERIDLDKFKTVKEPVGSSMIDALEDLESMSCAVSGIHEKRCEQEEQLRRVQELEQEFKMSGTEYECPVYGKVVFDGTNCVPDNN